MDNSWKTCKPLQIYPKFINDKSYILDTLFEGLSEKAGEISKILKQDSESNDLNHDILNTLDQLHISDSIELVG